MKVNLVRIGNSRGIRIPKPLLQQCGIAETVELLVRKNQIVLRASRRPRAGWDEAFRRMHAAGDDAPLMPDALPSTTWDRTEWTW